MRPEIESAINTLAMTPLTTEEALAAASAINRCFPGNIYHHFVILDKDTNVVMPGMFGKHEYFACEQTVNRYNREAGQEAFVVGIRIHVMKHNGTGEHLITLPVPDLSGATHA